jgi:anti-sigma regulatory factor (Ser/Thr protein kinase)
MVMPVLARTAAEPVRHYSEHLAASDHGVRTVRRTVTAVMRRWGLDDATDVVELLLSELLTNVLVHVGKGAPHGLTLTHRPGRLRVEVRDPSPRLPAPRRGDLDEESGRGLALVDCLASAWGAHTAADGKVVWFEIGR